MLRGLLRGVGRVRAVGPRTMQCLSFGEDAGGGLEDAETRLVCSSRVSFVFSVV